MHDEPGQAWKRGLVRLRGPKEYDRLKRSTSRARFNFGGFPLPQKYGRPADAMARSCRYLLLMNWTYKHVGNYGIAIILLRSSRSPVLSLTVKSMRSMRPCRRSGRR